MTNAGAEKQTHNEGGGRVHSNEQFGKLPKELMHNKTITDGAKVLYAHMHWRYGLNHKNFEGMASMAELLGVTEKTISRRITELEKARWIVVLDRPKKEGQYITNFYHVFESVDKCIAWLQSPEDIEEGDVIRLPLDRKTKVSTGRRTRKSDGRKTKVSDNTDSVIQTQLNIGASAGKSKSSKGKPPSDDAPIPESDLKALEDTINGMDTSFKADELSAMHGMDESKVVKALVQLAKANRIDYDGITKIAYQHGSMPKPEAPAFNDLPRRVNGYTAPRSIKYDSVRTAVIEAFGWTEATMTDNEKGLVNHTAKQLSGAGVYADEVKALHDHVTVMLKAMGTTTFKPTALLNHVSDWRNRRTITESKDAPRVVDQLALMGIE